MFNRNLLALINSDESLEGSRDLEGLPLAVPTEFLVEFFINNKDVLIDIFKDDLFKKIEISSFIKKLTVLIFSIEQRASIFKQLKPLVSEAKATHKTLPSLVKKKLPNVVLPLVNKILQLNAKTEESFLMPGGWGTEKGHAILYEFQKDKDGNLVFILYNSGSGLKYHKEIPGKYKDKFESMMCFSIPKEDLTQEKLQFFISELLKTQVIPELDPTVLYTEYTLYKKIFSQISHLHGFRID